MSVALAQPIRQSCSTFASEAPCPKGNKQQALYAPQGRTSMDWISGVTRRADGKLQVDVMTKNGMEARDVTQLRPTLDLYAPVHRNLRIHLARFQCRPAKDFLTAVGKEWLAQGRQPVYEAQTGAIRVVIPAQLLVVACFGSHQPLREKLLSPSGLQQLGDDLRTQERSPKQSQALLDKLRWILHYPSALESWASVYRRALDGQFDLLLPQAIAELSTWGCVNGDTFLVTRAQLVAVMPTEAARAGDGSGRRIVFDQTAGPRSYPAWVRRQPCDERVLPLVPERRLSDSQWAVVHPILTSSLGHNRPGRPGPLPRYDLRSLVDAMLLKLSAPCSWREVPGNQLLVQRAAVLLRSLQRKGLWDKVLAALAGTST